LIEEKVPSDVFSEIKKDYLKEEEFLDYILKPFVEKRVSSTFVLQLLQLKAKYV
jgi:hypothetical protein